MVFDPNKPHDNLPTLPPTADALATRRLLLEA